MEPRIALITIVTGNIGPMVRFYRDVLGFVPTETLDDADLSYTEFQHEGVRFALCPLSIMHGVTGSAEFERPASGQRFELAFPCASEAEVDAAYVELVEKGAVAVKGPDRMPWGQYTAFFADPDGNIHELFADAPAG